MNQEQLDLAEKTNERYAIAELDYRWLVAASLVLELLKLFLLEFS